MMRTDAAVPPVMAATKVFGPTFRQMPFGGKAGLVGVAMAATDEPQERKISLWIRQPRGR